jgi:hypothetical protein
VNSLLDNMIQYKITNTNTTNEKGSILYIKDDSIGYGVDTNPDRESMALLLLSMYVGSKGEVVSKVDAYDPLTVDTFNARVGIDGWYKFSLLNLPLFDPIQLPNYTVGEVYYDVLTGELLQVIPGLNIGGLSTLTTVKVIELSTLASSKYVVAITDAFIVYQNSKTKIQINGQISDLLTNNVDFTDKRLIRLKDNYNAVRAILQGAVYEFCRGNKYVAQKSIEFLNTNDYVSV